MYKQGKVRWIVTKESGFSAYRECRDEREKCGGTEQPTDHISALAGWLTDLANLQWRQPCQCTSRVTSVLPSSAPATYLLFHGDARTVPLNFTPCTYSFPSAFCSVSPWSKTMMEYLPLHHIHSHYPSTNAHQFPSLEIVFSFGIFVVHALTSYRFSLRVLNALCLRYKTLSFKHSFIYQHQEWNLDLSLTRTYKYDM